MIVNLKHKKILLIEDYSSMRMSIREMLHQSGSQSIHEADSAKAALAHLEKLKFDIILCDFNLGVGKNGQQFLEEAKFRKLLPYSTIFIMVTAEQTQSMVLSAMESKPDEYLTKPFNAHQLLTRINKQIARKNYFNDIDQAIEKDDLPLAISQCNHLLQGKDQRMRTHLLKIGAELAINVGDFKTAERHYQEVLSHRDLAWAKLGLGINAFLQNKLEVAIPYFQDVILQAPMLMEAYDWLSDALEAVEKRVEAQETLSQATELSPQAIRRQQKLALLAEQTGNLEVAERAYRAAIFLGKHSIYRSSRDFSGLAKVYTKNNDVKAALKLLAEMRETFLKDPEADLRAANLEIEIHLSQNDLEMANKAYEKLEHMLQQKTNVPKELLLDLAETHFAMGKTDAANQLIADLIANHADDEGFMHALVERHKGFSKDENYAQELFKMTKQELIKINNEGVNLFKLGEVNSAFEVLEGAFNRMPNNKTIIMNLAKILIRDMKTAGVTRDKIVKLRSLLSKASDLGVSKDKIGFIKMELSKLIPSKSN